MEERKLLWVVLLLALFILVVSGSIFYVYSPSKSQSYASSEDLLILNEISDASSSNKIDPDMWSRQLENVPDFQVDESDAENKKTITMVDGSVVHEDKQYIDVSSLDSGEEVKLEKKLPEEVAKELKINDNSKVEEKLPEDQEDKYVKIEKKPIVKAKAANKKIENSIKKPFVKTEKKVDKKIVEPRHSLSSIETVYWVQTASLSSKLNAEKARDKLVSRHMKVEIFTKETASGLTHRVRVGPFRNNTEAEYWLKNIKEIKGFERSYISQERIRA